MSIQCAEGVARLLVITDLLYCCLSVSTHGSPDHQLSPICPLPQVPGTGSTYHMAPLLPLRRTIPQPPRVRVVTECSGLEPLPYVLNKLAVPFQMVSACDVSPACRRLIRQCHHGDSAPKDTLCDILARNASDLPDHDLYVAGFPCQPYSSMGRNRGHSDPRGGQIVKAVLHALAAKQPKAFILENVKGIISSKHKSFFDALVSHLRAAGGFGYHVAWRLFDTADFGLPQHRERVYIVGVRKDVATKWRWPKPCKRNRTLASLLEPIRTCPRHAEKQFLQTCSRTCRRALQQAIAEIELQRLDRFDDKVGIIIDIDSSKPRWMVGCCPCITRARGGTGFYVPSRGRRLTLKERLRLQGLPTSILKHREGVTDRQLGQMIGNAMSGNVLCALVPRVLEAAGLGEPACPN